MLSLQLASCRLDNSNRFHNQYESVKEKQSLQCWYKHRYVEYASDVTASHNPKNIHSELTIDLVNHNMLQFHYQIETISLWRKWSSLFVQFSLSPLSSPLIMVVHIEVNNLTRREHLNLGLSYNKYTKKVFGCLMWINLEKWKKMLLYTLLFGKFLYFCFRDVTSVCL